MYLNFKTLLDKDISGEDFIILIAVSQKEWGYLIDNLLDEDYERFKLLSLVEHIKAKHKSEHLYESLRLSKKGKDLLSSLQEAEVAEEDRTIFEWLKKHYLKMGKEVGNGAKTQRHIRDFRLESGIEKNNLLRLCLDLLNSEDAMEYNHKLEFLFYKPPTAFETRFQLEESRLYKHYIKNKERLDKSFEQY